MSELKTGTAGDLTYKYKLPSGDEPYPVVLLLHGLTGDENSMWVFTHKLPKDFLLIALRAPYPSPMGGYSWVENFGRVGWPGVDDFRPAIDQILEFTGAWAGPPADFTKFRVMGFSQGAALAYAMALVYPGRVQAVAGLSGFMPEGVKQEIQGNPLTGIPIFASHGTQDTLVPVARARQGVRLLQEFGAMVTYCEDDVGHKLSANCFNGVEVFFT